MEATGHGCHSGDLYLCLNLAIAFIPVGDLGGLAAVDRSCRRAAIASYRHRLSTPSSVLKHPLVGGGGTGADIAIKDSNVRESGGTKIIKPLVFDCRSEKLPKSYDLLNPWSSMRDMRPGHSIRTIALDRDSSADWKVRWATLPTGEWREAILLRPDQLGPPHHRATTVCHYSVRGDSLLVLASKKISVSGDDEAAREDDSSEDEDLAKELWGLLYSLPPRGEGKGREMRLRPTMANKLLTETTNISWSGNYDTIYFGQACRSGDGRIIAVVTGIPNVEYDLDEGARVTVFEIEGGRFRRGHDVPVDTFNAVADYSGVALGLSTGGEILSVLNEEMYDDEGGWTVYDVRDGCRKLFSVRGFRSGGNHGYFTPDNDFVLHAPGAKFDHDGSWGRMSFPAFAGSVVCHVNQRDG